MAELQDMFLVIAVMLGLGVAMLTSHLILTKFVEATNESQAINTTFLVKGQGTIETFDATFGFVIIGASIALFVGAFFTDQPPAFLPFNLLIYIILIFVAAQMSNVFIIYSSTPSLVATANQFPTMIFVWQNLPFIVLVLMAATLIVGFAKVASRRGGSSV